MQQTISMETVIDSDAPIAVFDTTDVDRVLGLFKRMTLTTGRAVYDWNPEHGLYRLGVEHIFIPRTRTPYDVLSYIAASRHYGIYVLRGLDSELQKPAIQTALRKFAEKKGNVRRLIILMGDNIQLPSGLSDVVVHVRHAVRERSEAQI